MMRTSAYLIAVILLATAFAAFWIHYGVFTYSSFRDGYFDIGIETISMYQHLACNASSQLANLPVFGNHQSPTFLLFLPIFAAFQSPITLFVIQDIALALTAVVAYLVGRDVLKSEKIGFALAFAFIINLGVSSMASFDFHAEAFIPLFFVLAFYFYMTRRPKFFLASLLLLMGLIDIYSYIIAATLVAALLLYEWHYESKEPGHAPRMRLLMFAAVMIVVLAAAEQLLAIYITSQTQLLGLTIPPTLRLAYGQLSLGNVFGGSASVNQNIPVEALGVLLVFFGYGYTSLSNLFISLLMFAPWLKGALISPANQALFGLQYYGFVEGASVVAAVIGILVLRKKGKNLSDGFLMKSILLFAILIPLLAASAASVLVFDMANSFLGLHGFMQASEPTAYSSLLKAISLIPRNASVLSQSEIAPHLYYICNLEYSKSQVPGMPLSIALYVKPQYIIMDKYLGDYQSFIDPSVFNITGYISGNYTLVYNQSGAMLYKANGS